MDMDLPVTSPESIPAGHPIGSSARPLRSRFLMFFWRSCQFLTLAALVLGSYLVISRFFLQSVKVVGMSMAPTLQDSEHYLLNRWVYYVRSPHRTDIVVIRDPADSGFSVKRIVAVSGDSIFLKNGDVYLNGHKLSEPYLAADTPTFTNSKFRNELVVCGKNQYFLLGDNRMNSADSRSYGPVARGNILGLIVH